MILLKNNTITNDLTKGIDKNVLPPFIIFSILSFFLCLVLTTGTSKFFLTFLPLCFAIMAIILNVKKQIVKDNTAITLIETLYFVRLSILPLIYSFNTNYQLFESNYNVCGHFKEACLLMVYEFIVVQIVIMMHLLIKKHKHITINSKKTLGPKIGDYLMILLFLFIIITAVFFNSYIPSFKTIFSLGEYEFTIATNKTIYSVHTFGRIINTMFIVAFLLFRILFPAYILKKSYSKNGKHSLLILVFSCFLQFLFLTSTFAEAIISCFCLLLYYIKLYPEKRKKTILLLLISTLGIFFLYFIVRFYVKANMKIYDKSNPIVYIGQMTNAYFTGIDNVSAMFNVSGIHRIEALKADLIGAIPFNSSIFGDRGNKLQYYFNLYNKSYGQIPPTIGAGYYYFGVYLSPLISAIFAKISLLYFDRSNKIKESFDYVAMIFCSIIFAFGLVMYSPAITLSWYLSWGIPMLLISRYSDVN